MDAGILALVAALLLVAAVIVVTLRRRSAPEQHDETLRAGEAGAVSARDASNRAQGANAWTRIGGGGSGI